MTTQTASLDDCRGRLPGAVHRLRRQRHWLIPKLLAALTAPAVLATSLSALALGSHALGVSLGWLLAVSAMGALAWLLVLRPMQELADAAPAQAWEPAAPGVSAELGELKRRIREQHGELGALKQEKEGLSGEIQRLLAEQHTASAALNSAVTLTHDRLVLTDAEGRVRDISPTALELLDLSRADVLGRHFHDAVAIYDASKHHPLEYRLRDFLPRVLENRSTTPRLEDALLVDRRGRKHPLLLSAAAILEPGGRLVGALARLEPYGAGTGINAPPPSQTLSTDEATGLPNLRAFERRVDELVKVARAQNAQHALLFLSPDGFEEINVQYTHWAGEELLWQIGQILRQECPTGADAFRVGSHHLAVLVPFTLLAQAQQLAEKIRVAVDGREFKWNELRFEATVSIGVIPVGPDAEGHKVLVGLANKALAAAKLVTNQVSVHAPDAQLDARRRKDREWVSWVGKRVKEGHAQLLPEHVQPLRGSGQALLEFQLRIAGEDGKPVPPGAFLPALVRHNVTAQFDLWLLRRVLRGLVDQPWMISQYDAVAIGIARSSVTEPNFAERVSEALAESTVPPARVCFEIDALTAINHPSDVHRFVRTLEASGARFALNRCKAALGLNALSTLPIHYVKIHEALIAKALKNPVDLGYVRWINQVTHELGRQTIAMGVDSPELMKLMISAGVDFVQGSFVQKPVQAPKVDDELEMPPSRSTPAAVSPVMVAAANRRRAELRVSSRALPGEL